MADTLILNCVAIVDSIPEGELNTARALRHRLADAAYATDRTPGIAYARTPSREAFLTQFDELLRLVTDEGMRPVIHIEAHGWESGIELATGERIFWGELAQLLAPISVAMRLGPLVVLASCEGGSFAKAIRLHEPAPLWGLIGPKHEIAAGHLEADFRAFYVSCFRRASMRDMMSALRARSTEDYFYTSAESFFRAVWANYVDSYCTPGRLSDRYEMARTYLESMGRPVLSQEQYLALLRQSEKRNLEIAERTFFMLDKYPENADRFDLELGDIRSL